MAKYLELYIDQYSDYSKDLIIYNEYDQRANIQGCNISASFAKSYSSNSISFDTSIKFSGNGVITLGLNSMVTSNTSPGRYYYDVILECGGIKVKKYEGIVIVNPGVTR